MAFRWSSHLTTHKHKHFIVKPHSLCQALLLQEVSSWRPASYKNFLAVHPAHYKKQIRSLSDILHSSWSCSHNTHTHTHTHTLFGPSQNILLLKGTKYHLYHLQGFGWKPRLGWGGDNIRIDLKSFERMWTGLICLMTETRGWLLWTR